MIFEVNENNLLNSSEWTIYFSPAVYSSAAKSHNFYKETNTKGIYIGSHVILTIFVTELDKFK